MGGGQGGLQHEEAYVSAEMREYGRGHDARFGFLEHLIDGMRLDPGAKVLDIGPGPMTLRLLDRFEDVTTLGLAEARELICRIPDRVPHVAFDLNDCREPDRWIRLPRFDLIVFSEVIEHLHASPRFVLGFLATALGPGGRLVVQTPNATSLDKRLKMIAGVHPFEPIREEWRNPGHFREYTRHELEALAAASGLDVDRHYFRSYFRSRKPVMRAIDAFVAFVPSLRRGQTIVLRTAAVGSRMAA